MASRNKITYSSHPSHAARSAHAKGARQFKTYDTSHIRPKKSKGPVIFGGVLVVIIAILLIVGGFFFFRSCSAGSDVLAEGETATVVIPGGSGVTAIGNLLKEEHVIASSNEFVSRVNTLEAESDLKPGTYTFTGEIGLDEVITILRAGPDGAGKTFTIPEGFTIEQTAERIAEVFEGAITAEDFAARAHSASEYVADFPFVEGAYDNSLEGFLFPKTYPLKEGETADSLVRMMLTQYQAEVATLDYTYAESQGLTPYQVLILASIIEKEASSDQEIRARVSSVFYNRLAIDMRLQSDATTAYVVKQDPTADDIANDDSPYSTYNNDGLPAGPICSPGLACLQAATTPEITEYYYFYFTDRSGEMEYFFSTTNEEHNEAIFGSN